MTSPSPIGLILSAEEVDRLRGRLGKGAPIRETWKPNPGMQEEVLRRTEHEILVGGGRYGGKSEVARAFLVKGNPDLPNYGEDGNPIWVNMSYVYHPHYRGLMVRRNQQDLDDFIQKAIRMYAPYGGEFVSGQFRFPSGAIIDTGHLKDKEAWMKHIGVEHHRIVLEEAGIIPDISIYEELKATCRSPYPEIRQQILLTANPGGPGTGWLLDRFIEAKGADGKIVPPLTTIRERYEDPFTRRPVESTRVFVFSNLADNPHAVNDRTYIASLASISDPNKRRAYLIGDWTSMSGTFFSIFRPRGPASGEPANANHVIPAGSAQPMPWWHTSIGCDWGFGHEAAVYWLKHDPRTKQVHIYRELVTSATLPSQLGYEIALRSRQELMDSPSHSVVLHLSHDAFDQRTGEKSIAELIASGIARVLGPNSVHLPDLEVRRLKEAVEIDPSGYPSDEAREKFWQALRVQRRAGITLRIAPKDRVMGWQCLLEFMRWEPLGELRGDFDPAVAMNILREEGADKWLQYVRIYQERKPEILPRLQIWDCCKRLIEAIPKCMRDEKRPEDVSKSHFLGLDSCDSVRYLLAGFRDESPPEPFEEFRERKLEEVVRSSVLPATTSDLCRINQSLEAEWKGKNRKGAFMIPRRRARAGLGGIMGVN